MPGFHRKVIHITAADSPNVRLALEEIRRGLPVSNTIVVPGVLSYQEYKRRRAMWPVPKQTVGLDARFYEGPEEMLFPEEWLHNSILLYQKWLSDVDPLSGAPYPIRAEAIGVDPGEGVANTSLAAGGRNGLVELWSEHTSDTSRIPAMVKDFMRRHGVPANKVFIDRGGGGKQHADILRAQGHKVNTVGFGEAAAPEPRRGVTWFSEKMEQRDESMAYKNRRAQMYGMASEIINPNYGKGWAIPPPDAGPQYARLHQQLAAIPRMYDPGTDKLMLPPKGKSRDLGESVAGAGAGARKVTMYDLIGHSPDEADAVVLMVYGLEQKASLVVVGAE